LSSARARARAPEAPGEKPLGQSAGEIAAGDSILTGTATFLLPTELVDDADRAGLQMAENGTRYVAGASLAERYFANRTDGLRPSSGEDLLVATI
jgi:hypothetical protein